MTFVIENEYDLPLDLLKAQLIRSARRRIAFYKEACAEKLLSKKLLEDVRLTLKAACMRILMNSYVMKDYATGRLIAKIQDPKLDRLARFITFGDGETPGSQILRFAYNQK